MITISTWNIEAAFSQLFNNAVGLCLELLGLSCLSCMSCFLIRDYAEYRSISRGASRVRTRNIVAFYEDHRGNPEEHRGKQMGAVDNPQNPSRHELLPVNPLQKGCNQLFPIRCSVYADHTTPHSPGICRRRSSDFDVPSRKALSSFPLGKRKPGQIELIVRWSNRR